MVKVHVRVKSDLVLGGKVVSPGSLRISEVLSGEQDCPKTGQLDGMYLAVFLGGDCQTFCLERIPDNGVTELAFDYPEGAPDTLKFAVCARSITDKTARCNHVASTFMHRDNLVQCLDDPGRLRLGFTADQPALKGSDNFTRNTFLLRFLNVDTDLQALSRQRQAPSALLRMEEANEAVKRLGAAVEQRVSSCAISAMNAGCQFVQGFTYFHMGGFLTNYAILGEQLSDMDSPVSLCMLMYSFFQAVHSTGLKLSAMESVPDADLARRLGVPGISRFTSCALTNVYCPDMTLSLAGSVCKLKDTEDIGKTFSRLCFEVQNAGGPLLARQPQGVCCAVDASRPEEWLAGAVGSVMESQKRIAENRDGFGGGRSSPAALADDCENSALANMFYARGIRAACDRYPTGPELASAMRAEAARLPHVFGALTEQDHGRMARLLHRLAGMLRRGDWALALGVASAKGPSYTEDNPQEGAGLCGHGVCISRVFRAETGMYEHCPVEGTTYLKVDTKVPEGHAEALPLRLADGSVQTFPVETAMTLLAQNLHEMVGLSAHANMLAHIRQDYGDKPLSCPFYVSIFYANLPQGEQECLGCIPLDTQPPKSFRAGAKPVFGAPVMGLSSPGTMSFPITADLLAEGKPGQGQKLRALLRDVMREAYGPGITEEQSRAYVSHLQPVQPTSGAPLGAEDLDRHMTSENTWAFDDPGVARDAVRIYSALADKYNEIQARDPESDGGRARAFGQFLSAALTVHIPLPTREAAQRFSLSTVRNMKQAADELGLTSAISACLLKKQSIRARSAVATEHHVYMCDQGGGPVHAHRVKLR